MSNPHTFNVMPTSVDATSVRFEKNMRAMAALVAGVHNEEEDIAAGGGARAIENQHNKGRLTARERIALLLDSAHRFLSSDSTPPTKCMRSGEAHPPPA